MASEWVQAAGGLGLFLLGMVIMTEGLRSLAGDALQRALRRFTHSPFSGAMTGMAITALVQSSSATTVAAVGFAGAGLLTFPQALGIVFGANVGTTVTGWAVALLGFKWKLDAILPPIILVGALLRLFGRRRVAALGYTLAGFGLVFMGLGLLQTGMSGIETLVTPERFPPDTVVGRLALVGLGIAITLVTQSSSAGVATALAAVHTDTISFVQACAMVIGMDVGTTVTAAFAATGGSLAARRTGWAHVVYNVLTAVGAFALLPLYAGGLAAFWPEALRDDPELCLVGFHTLFNGLGLLAVLPFAGGFARLLERLIPERPVRWTERLDRALLRDPAVALRAVEPTLADLASRSFDLLADCFAGREIASERREWISRALEETRTYLARIETPQRGGAADAREIASLHVIDQLRRLLGRLGQDARLAALQREPRLRDEAARLMEALESARHESGTGVEALEAAETRLVAARDSFRHEMLDHAARDEMSSDEALARLDAWRWLERVTHHVVRILHHTRELQRERPTPSLGGNVAVPDA